MLNRVISPAVSKYLKHLGVIAKAVKTVANMDDAQNVDVSTMINHER